MGNVKVMDETAELACKSICWAVSVIKSFERKITECTIDDTIESRLASMA